MVRLILSLALGLALLVGSLPAQARLEMKSEYTKARTFSAALRYLRVDLGYEVTERDEDAAYLLFKFVPRGRKDATFGSIEIIESKDKVRVFIQLPKMPSYRERVLGQGLERKLRSEYGAPPKPDKDKEDDKDKDGDDDNDKNDKKKKNGKQKKKRAKTIRRDGRWKDE